MGGCLFASFSTLERSALPLSTEGTKEGGTGGCEKEGVWG